MKKYILLFLLFSCEEPSVFSPSAGCMNENASNYNSNAISDDGSCSYYIDYAAHYETVDACRAIDVSNNILVAAASSNGYFRYNIGLNEDGNSYLDESTVFHISDINTNVGDDAAYDVAISNNVSNMAFILDDVDNIMVNFFDQEDSQTLAACGNSLLYRSFAINDDVPDTTILFTLQKHFDVVPDEFDLYSTSIGIRKFYMENIFGDDLFSASGCDAVINPSIEAMDVFYSDNILSFTNGGMGVELWRYNHSPVEGEELLDSLTTFYLQGGEAESLYSKGNHVIGGFDNDRGCNMVLLDSNGSISDNLLFADGYSIESIDYNSGLLALAAGNDCTLLYDWNEDLNVNYLGVIDSGEDNFVYDVKVQGSTVYTASENGISIYEIKK